MFNAIPIKIPMIFITEIKKINPKVHLEAQKARNSQGKKSNTGNIKMPNFKLYCRVIAIKTIWH
jgi:hypothetical protein